MSPRLAVAAAVALCLAACSPAADAPAADAPRADAPGVAADAGVPARTGAAEPAPAPVPAVPAAGPAYDASVIDFGGYRSAPFNSDAATLRAAAGGELRGGPEPGNGPDSCHYLMPPAGTEGYRYAFMLEGAKFVRMDVRTTDVVAPGGLVVGMTTADVLAAFPATGQQPHKYTDGKYLIVAPPDGGEGRLVFEVDAAGTITRWRIGVEPQVHYVEGCN